MTPDALREIIRDIVREVIREVVVEEMALGAAVSSPAAPRTASTRPSGPTQRTPPSTTADGVHIARGALTERHLRSLGEARVVHIGHAVVITPLARDWARAKGIDIIRIDG